MIVSCVGRAMEEWRTVMEETVGEKEGLRSFSVAHVLMPMCGRTLMKQVQKSELKI